METVNYFRSIPTPNEWLARIVVERGISGNSLARMIGQSGPQVNRWINSKEKIPRHHLSEIAMQIGMSGEFEYVNQLKTCEELTAQLQKQIFTLAEIIAVDVEKLQTVFLNRIEELAIKEMNPISANYLSDIICQFITDANFAIRLIIAMLEVDFIEPIITHENVVRHLRYPVNHMVGIFLSLAHKEVNTNIEDSSLGETKSNMLENLRRIVESTKPNNQTNSLIRMHSVHLLSRYGEPSDRSYIEALIHSQDKLLDPLTKRLGFMGVILGRDNQNSTEYFLHELKRDEELAKVDIMFDAIHYGDVNLNINQQIPQDTAQLARTTFHILRHIKDCEAYGNILPTEVYKLLRILDQVGINLFLNAFILMELRNILQNDSFHILLSSGQYQSVQHDFDKQFSRLLDVGIQQGFIDA